MFGLELRALRPLAWVCRWDEHLQWLLPDSADSGGREHENYAEESETCLAHASRWGSLPGRADRIYCQQRGGRVSNVIKFLLGVGTVAVVAVVVVVVVTLVVLAASGGGLTL